MLRFVLFLTLGTFAGCTTSIPKDLLWLHVDSLSPDSHCVFLITETDGHLSSVPWYLPADRWLAMHPTGDRNRERRATEFWTWVQRVQANRYGVVVRDKFRHWRVWWFDAGEVRLPALDDPRDRKVFELSLDPSRKPEFISYETLVGLGIDRGLPKPLWRSPPPGEERSPYDPATLVVYCRGLFDDLHALEALLTKGDIGSARESAVGIVDTLEFLTHVCNVWEDRHRAAVEAGFKSYLEFDQAAESGDLRAAFIAAARTRQAIEQLTAP